jgi:hypothetical protein
VDTALLLITKELLGLAGMRANLAQRLLYCQVVRGGGNHTGQLKTE